MREGGRGGGVYHRVREGGGGGVYHRVREGGGGGEDLS